MNMSPVVPGVNGRYISNHGWKMRRSGRSHESMRGRKKSRQIHESRQGRNGSIGLDRTFSQHGQETNDVQLEVLPERKFGEIHVVSV